jgi:hydrogenase expression/formation protein HypC
MCVAVPAKIIEIEGPKAKVSIQGNILDINTGLIEAKEGDYVLVHAGCALEVVEEETANEIMRIFEEMKDASDEKHL